MAFAEPFTDAAEVFASVHRAIEIVLTILSRGAIGRSPAESGELIAVFVRTGIAVVRTAILAWLTTVRRILAAFDRIAAGQPEAWPRRTDEWQVSATLRCIDVASVNRADIIVIAGESGVLANRPEWDAGAFPVAMFKSALIGVSHAWRTQRGVVLVHTQTGRRVAVLSGLARRDRAGANNRRTVGNARPQSVAVFRGTEGAVRVTRRT